MLYLTNLSIEISILFSGISSLRQIEAGDRTPSTTVVLGFFAITKHTVLPSTIATVDIIMCRMGYGSVLQTRGLTVITVQGGQKSRTTFRTNQKRARVLSKIFLNS